MKHVVAWSGLLAVAFLAGAPFARAQETIYVRGKDAPMRQFIEAESVKGIKIKKGDLIPAQEIQDIIYENIQPTTAMVSAYRPATLKERVARGSGKDQDRLKALGDAVVLYGEALKKISPAAEYAYARRQIEYKVAALQALQAELDGKENSAILAIVKYKDFKAKHPNSWQLPHVLVALVKLQLEQKNFDDAQVTLAELAKADVPEATRQDADLMVAQMSMRSGRYAEAQKKLAELAAALPKDSHVGMRARLAQAECLAATKNLKGAQDSLKTFLSETKDKEMRAVAYNTLGYCYYLTDQLDQLREARWAFLWVDVEYNQNKTEHAKALYYLWHIFNRLNEPDRAQECWEALVNDQQFAGIEWQAKAKQEKGQ